jgi:hypothetical protein
MGDRFEPRDDAEAKGGPVEQHDYYQDYRNGPHFSCPFL